MTLTVVVGASGSGKTTFLNDVAKRHKCTYIRQYHGIRPYITVTKIPRFDPTELPYWNIYEREKTADSIVAGGTMAGEFIGASREVLVLWFSHTAMHPTAGLSGGQRKLLLFELIYQRTLEQKNLLLVLDEPFAGVTDDFIPFIVQRLNAMRERHNILLVTNDHVEVLKEMADNDMRVSAVDRTIVQINGKQEVNREKVILALSVGEQYAHNASWDDIKFFVDVEILTSGSLMAVAVFTMVAFGLFAAAFWDSNPTFGPFVIVAASIISFFCLHPYLLSLVDWRNYMSEEAEALLHSSKATNKILKTFLTLILIVLVSLVEWGVVNLVITGFESRRFWVAMLMDNASLTFPFIFFGLFTKLPETRVQIGASLPFLLMIFLSGTFSPSAGLPGLKALRYLFVRFYFWCMIPGVESMMEGCPSDDSIIGYTVLSALVGSALFLAFVAVRAVIRVLTAKELTNKHNDLKDAEFDELQVELYGEYPTAKDFSKSIRSVLTGSMTASEDSGPHSPAKRSEFFRPESYA